MFERLEMRRLLSVSASFDPKGGMLYVIGSNDPETIEVQLEVVTNAFTKFVNGPRETGTQVRVFDGGKNVYTQRLGALDLKMMLVNGAGGDDLITVHNASAVTIDICGGTGNDMIESTSVSGAPGSAVYAETGDDIVFVYSGKGSVAGHFVEGADGNDFIVGSDSGDWLYGDEAYKLALEEFEGNDFIFAGAGDDSVWGGAGDDVLYGEDGNDRIFAGFGADKVSGGEGKDVGVLDTFDSYDDLEEVIFVK